MKTTILAYVIALGGVAMIAFGLWGLYILIREGVARRLRDYVPTIQTIAVGCEAVRGACGQRAGKRGPKAVNAQEATDILESVLKLMLTVRGDARAEAIVASKSFASRLLRPIQAKKRSTTQRRGWTAKPI